MCVLKHKKQKNALVIQLTGELDHSAAAKLRLEIDELIMDPKVKQLIFDMDDLSFMDSSGIGMIIGRYKLMKKKGGTGAVGHCSRQVDKIIEKAGLYQIIEKLA